MEGKVLGTERPGDINTCHKTLDMMTPVGHTCLTTGNSCPLLAFRSHRRRRFLTRSANVSFLRGTWLHGHGELWFSSVRAVRNATTPLCLMAFTEGITLCEKLYVSFCLLAVTKVLLLYQATRITCFQVTSPKSALNSMHVTLVLTYKRVILLLHFW
jgi:hypothetical protein